ncbi:Alpha,alpha-trehalose-phosphate synthase [UDP-forming] 5 [Dendrobium catenatum]|uniref:Alpha,alpha-trehalose-phosphate synthase [UDP-forming] 5 n=1 Tax=Dendrobium catenatum TaxID=906689 RepID=A0A2I0WWN1_9ASPA|nr:Alpha,alpha-trehalose-phosphate synthase [UDP-forming] 5 [Dendrobium catenatum]
MSRLRLWTMTGRDPSEVVNARHPLDAAGQHIRRASKKEKKAMPPIFGPEPDPLRVPSFDIFCTGGDSRDPAAGDGSGRQSRQTTTRIEQAAKRGHAVKLRAVTRAGYVRSRGDIGRLSAITRASNRNAAPSRAGYARSSGSSRSFPGLGKDVPGPWLEEVHGQLFWFGLQEYNGTMMPQTSISKKPTPEVISILNSLVRYPDNLVFLVSGKEWFMTCSKLALGAEHGFFMRQNQESEWETCVPVSNFDWMQIVEHVMQLYTETTNGSSIEVKESVLVWHYQYAYPDFGSCQAKELLYHMENITVFKVYRASGLMGMHQRCKVFDPGIWLGCSLSRPDPTGTDPDDPTSSRTNLEQKLILHSPLPPS